VGEELLLGLLDPLDRLRVELQVVGELDEEGVECLAQLVVGVVLHRPREGQHLRVHLVRDHFVDEPR
jgi:hypothetical protein